MRWPGAGLRVAILVGLLLAAAPVAADEEVGGVQQELPWTWAGFLAAIVAGFFLASAPFWAKSSWLRKPAHLESKRLGIDLTADSRTLIVFIGALLVLGGGHALYRADREDLETAQSRAEEAREQYLESEATLRRFLDEGTKYPLKLVPVFDEVSQDDLERNPGFYFDAEVEIEMSPSGQVLAGEALKTGLNDWGLRVIPSGMGLLIEGEVTENDVLRLIVRHGKDLWRGSYQPPNVELPLTWVPPKDGEQGG